MPDPKRTAARDLLTQAADAGVHPLMLTGSPWAIRQDLLKPLFEAARFPETAGAVSMKSSREAPEPERAGGGVAVIPLTGIITPQGSFLSWLFTGSMGGLLAFGEQLDEAVASPDVTAIVIDVDSPGGLVDLVPETAAAIRAARGSKPIIAIADTQMCSAAYWLAAQADEIVITPSGYAGSIGVYRVHEDWSKFNEAFGVAVTYVHAGKYKVEGNMDEPLSEEAQAKWQSDVEDAYAAFVADVSAGRGVSAQTVIADYGEGRTMNAKRALEAGLVDRIETYEALIKRLLDEASSSSSGSTALATQIAEALMAHQNTILQAQVDQPPPIAFTYDGQTLNVMPSEPPAPDDEPASADETPVLAAADRADIARGLAG